MTGDGFTIRVGEPADLIAVDRIERASFDDPWARHILLPELVPSALRLPLVAVCDGQVAGYLLAWRSGGELHILNVAVDPARRRSGLGAALLEAALADARRCGMGAVTLEVRPDNRPALSLYRSYGFEEAGVRSNYYVDTGEDALILTLLLKED